MTQPLHIIHLGDPKCPFLIQVLPLHGQDQIVGRNLAPYYEHLSRAEACRQVTMEPGPDALEVLPEDLITTEEHMQMHLAPVTGIGVFLVRAFLQNSLA